jgi:hypothetical protein
MTTEIVKHEESTDLFVFARNSEEMARTQEKTILGIEAKLAVEQERKRALEDNLAIAKKNKWRTRVIADNIRYAGNRVEFYEKVLDALRAGYQIIPEMGADVFAIRTTKSKPKTNQVGSVLRSTYDEGSMPKAQAPDYSPTGQGEYVAPAANYQERFSSKMEKRDEKDVELRSVTRWAVEHGEVEFPFQLVKPQILEMTAAAMEKKIFDELGVLPARRQKGDPIVVGRVTMKGRRAWDRKSVNFIVAWFLDLADI